MKRPSSYSADTKRAAVTAVNALESELSKHTHPTINPYTIASQIAGSASVRTIRRWRHQNLSPEAIEERKTHARRPRVISDDQEHLLIGYFIQSRLNLLSVNRDFLIKFAKDYLNLTLLPQRISEILKRNNITLQASRPRGSRGVSQKVVDDAVDFVRQVREMKYPPECVLVMDETGLWSNVQNPRTYHFKNWYFIPFFQT